MLTPSQVLLSPNTPSQTRIKHELTSRYLVELLMIHGVGYEVSWILPIYTSISLSGSGFGNRWREQFRKRCEAESFYEDKLRTVLIAEATLALGLTERR